MTILIVGQQGYTGGINGITDLRTLLGWDIRPDGAKIRPLFRFAASCCSAPCSWRAFVLSSKLGRILVATRDKEDRVRFLRLRRVQLQDLRLLASLRPWRRSAARCSPCRSASCRRPSSASCRRSRWSSSARSAVAISIVGAVVGTLLVNWGKTMFFRGLFRSSGCFAMGGLFIAVVIAFPRGSRRDRDRPAHSAARIMEGPGSPPTQPGAGPK